MYYTSWGLGGFVLSLIAGAINDATQTFTYAYFLAAGLLALAAVLMFLIKSPQGKDAPASIDELEGKPAAARKKASAGA